MNIKYIEGTIKYGHYILCPLVPKAPLTKHLYNAPLAISITNVKTKTINKVIWLFMIIICVASWFIYYFVASIITTLAIQIEADKN